MLKFTVIKLINFYQKFISPHKGFVCAHRVATGEKSCSVYGKHAIKKHGLFLGFKLLNRRFYDCSWFAKELKSQNQNGTYKRYKSSQAGFCDGCDVGDCGSCSSDVADKCDVLSCEVGDCGDLFGNDEKKKSFTEKRDLKNQNKMDDKNNEKDDSGASLDDVDLE